MPRTPCANYNPLVGADAHIGPPYRIPCNTSVGVGGCPPSCQPIPGHCRARQSGHFLETGSLHLPLAALRRFPRRPVFAKFMSSVGAGFYPARPLRSAHSRQGTRILPHKRAL